jgi:hypothetical protein|tara:strand:- start:500 stop:751 length:252 start_codon:yes stop_codon:yes gene_type:complete
MHDFDNDDIVVSGAGGSNYIKVGPRTNKKTGSVMPLKQAQEAARLKKKPKGKAAKNKKGVVGGKRIKPVTAKPKGKRKPMSRG